jgi:polygalacturonase
VIAAGAIGDGTPHRAIGRADRRLRDKVTLHLDEDATLLDSANLDDYRLADAFTDGNGAQMGENALAARRDPAAG